MGKSMKLQKMYLFSIIIRSSSRQCIAAFVCLAVKMYNFPRVGDRLWL